MAEAAFNIAQVVGWVFAAVFAIYSAIISFIVFPMRSQIAKTRDEFLTCKEQSAGCRSKLSGEIGALAETVRRHEETVRCVQDMKPAIARIEERQIASGDKQVDMDKKLDRLERKLGVLNGSEVA